MMPSTVKRRLVMRLAKRMLEFLAFGLLDRGVLRVAGTAVPVAGRTAIVQLELLGDFFLWLPFGQVLAGALASRGDEGNPGVSVRMCGAGSAGDSRVSGCRGGLGAFHQGLGLPGRCCAGCAAWLRPRLWQ